MERPILFSTDMVQALLAGRKTQTRRTKGLESVATWVDSFGFSAFTPDGHISGRGNTSAHGPAEKFYKMPYQKGDLLWVRENWQLTGWNLEEAEMQIKYQAGGSLWAELHCPKESFNWVENQIDQLESKGIIKQSPDNDDFFEFTDKPQPWKPNIHMPKSAARIWLKVTNVRVERLKDISKEDALAEGVFEIEKDEAYKDYMKQAGSYAGPIGSFFSLWESINGIDSLLANPWVWVVEFEVVSTTGRNNVKEVRA